jgi:hypothetical protein
MCTHVTQRVALHGSGKAGGEWTPLGTASVYVDHPYTTPLEHTLNIDVFPEGDDRSRRVALELSIGSAEDLLEALTRALDAARPV